MKKTLVTAVLGALAFVSQAALLNVVEVGTPDIDCLFSTNCSTHGPERSSPFLVPGTTGAAYVHSRVITADRGTLAAGHYAYEYQVDLSGVLEDPNNPTELTNVVRCATNRVEIRTNQVVCRTNIVGGSNRIICTTNRFPATNLVVCLTNISPATNIQQCFTNPAGVVVCFTNDFPSATNVVCFTNRVPARSFVTCQTNVVVPGVSVTVCTTNRVRYHTNLVVCRTNTTTAPGSPACVKSLRLPIGSIVSRLDLNGDGTNTDNVYVVSSGGSGSISPSSVEWDDDDLVLRFSPPLCAGESSYIVGIVARSAPQSVNAKASLTSGSPVRARVFAPHPAKPIRCDFDDLAKAVRNLRTRDLVGANDQVRENHRAALLRMVNAAEAAAQAGDSDGVAEALADLISKTDGRGQDWVTRDGRDRIEDELEDLLECLEEDEDRDDDDDCD